LKNAAIKCHRVIIGVNMKRLAQESTCAQCEPSNEICCEINECENETNGLTEGERLSEHKYCLIRGSSQLLINTSHCFCVTWRRDHDQPIMQASNQQKKLWLCYVMYILCSLSKSNSQFITSSVIRPHSFHRPHFLFFSFPFFFL
jgi:hypothetical protein